MFGDLPDDRPLYHAWRDRGWRAHAAVFVAVCGATIVLWLAVRDPHPLPRDYGSDYWWPLWLTLAWATAVLLHLLRTAGLLRVRQDERRPGRRHVDDAQRKRRRRYRRRSPTVSRRASARFWR